MFSLSLRLAYDRLPDELDIFPYLYPGFFLFMVENFPFLHDEDDIIGESREKWG